MVFCCVTRSAMRFITRFTARSRWIPAYPQDITATTDGIIKAANGART